MCANQMSITKLENLPNEIQLIILRYLSADDRYYSFRDLNTRFDHLIKRLTPSRLEDLPDQVQIMLFRRYFTLERSFSLFFGLNHRYNMLLVKLLPNILDFSPTSYSFEFSSLTVSSNTILWYQTNGFKLKDRTNLVL